MRQLNLLIGLLMVGVVLATLIGTLSLIAAHGVKMQQGIQSMTTGEQFQDEGAQ